jgi:hypothetical protein
MSTSTEPEQQVSQFDLETTPGQGGIGEAAGAYWERIKGGDLGALPAIFGIIVLVIVFGVMQPDSFLTEQNFANLINQGAAIMVLAMGLVFVLLLGEIDLSAGFTAGMGAAILGVTLTNKGWAWPLSVLAALGVAQTDQVLKLVRRLAEQGLGVVLITHNMNDVFQVADSIACLYLGQMAAQVRAKDVNNTQVIELITAGRSGDIGLRPAEAAAVGQV